MLAETVWDYYRHHGRDLPWRQPPFDPYHIMVSEVMLQQTQVVRVIPKYQAFIKQFPTVAALAKAPLADVLRAWSGLGYNRRAKYLQQAAQAVVNGFPTELSELVKLPSIGPNTAAAILVYAYNQPLPFIETNIRTVYIHHFFADQTDVDDRQLRPLIEETLDHEHPREWFWALMDYGSYLKTTAGNLSRHSKHYAKQSRFEGSQRQIRGQVLRLLGQQAQTGAQLRKLISDQRLIDVLNDLTQEGLISQTDRCYRLALN